jgi:putative ABC transport system permease protein
VIIGGRPEKPGERPEKPGERPASAADGPAKAGDARRGGRLFRLDPRTEVEEELAFHFEERVAEYERQGMDPAAARAAARARLGDLENVRANCTDLLAEERRTQAWRERLGDLRQDVAFALRSFGRAPLFTGLAVLTLALGIGANAAIFGVVKSVLLDGLPYQAPDRLVRVYAYWTDGSFDRFTLSAGSVRDIAERQTSFDVIGATAGGPGDAFFAAGDRTEMVRILWIEPAHLEALGTSPVLGRRFMAEDARDTAQVVLMSHATWRQRFGGESDVIGRVVRINDLPREIVGVLPPGFIAPAGEADYLLPLSLEPTLRNPVSARGTHWLWTYGRLRPGVTLETAQAELAGIGLDLAREHPQDNESIRISAEPVRDALVGDTRTPLLMLLASAGLVLLIACANLAGALLSRTLSRRREFAVRVSLGAGRGRLVRQLLTETTLLAIAGGAAGLLLATAALASLRGLSLDMLPGYAELTLDGGAMLVTFAVALLAGLAFGVAPALSVGRTPPQGALRDESRGTSEGRRARRLRGVLVTGQVALCLSLLAGTGLLARSLWAMAATPLGFDADDVLTVRVPLPNARYGTPEARFGFTTAFTERLRALPGVRAAAAAFDVPTRLGNRDGLVIEGRPWPAGVQTPFMLTNVASDEYFRTMGIPLRDGRGFSPTDNPESPPVVVISETMARRYWPEGNAVGARIRLGPDHEGPWIEVIGVVGDVRNDLTSAETEPTVYYAHRQGWTANTFVISTAGNPLALADGVRRTLEAVDPTLTLQDATTMRAVLGQGLSPRKLPLMLLAAFGALALLLVAMGVYAMFANMAIAREHEFGVRMALGSTRADVAALVLRQGALWLGAGLGLGLLGVIAITRVLGNMLFGVAPFDAVAIGAAVAALALCATLALIGPVLRATRVDPGTVMR